MAFCVKCGGQLVDGAQFCTTCGSPVASVPPAVPAQAPAVTTPAQPFAAAAAVPVPAAPRKRSPLVWIVPVLLLALVALAAGGWFVFGLVSGGTEGGRAKAQVETVAEFMQGYNEGDLKRVQSVLPAEFADEVEAAFGSGEDIGIDGEVTREWDGDVLVLTFDYADASEMETMRLTADGGKQRGVVTLEQVGTDGYTYEAVVVREAGHWVLAEIDGMPIADVWSSDEESDESSDDSSDSDDSTADETQQCWDNQAMIVEAANEWYNASADNFYDEIVGTVDFYHLLKQAGYLDITPTCPYDDSSYYLFDDGSTTCPSGEHGSYLYE